MIDLLPLYAEEGMQILDLNFCEMMNPKSVLQTEAYQTYLETLKALRERYDLTFHQAHAPYVQDRLALSQK